MISAHTKAALAASRAGGRSWEAFEAVPALQKTTPELALPGH